MQNLMGEERAWSVTATLNGHQIVRHFYADCAMSAHIHAIAIVLDSAADLASANRQVWAMGEVCLVDDHGIVVATMPAKSEEEEAA